MTRKGTITAISASAWARFPRERECRCVIPCFPERLESPLRGNGTHGKTGEILGLLRNSTPAYGKACSDPKRGPASSRCRRGPASAFFQFTLRDCWYAVLNVAQCRDPGHR